MKKTIHFLIGNAHLSISLSVLFLLVGLSTSTAQEVAGGTLNPNTHIANRLDVTAYPIGTFEHTHAVDVLQEIIADMRPLVSNGGGTLTQRMKVDFCSKVLNETKNYYIAVEISLISSLSELLSETTSTEVQLSQARAIYNEVVAQLQ